MAITTPNLGLRVWNLTTDRYDHAQLADNWAKIDDHDHSGGRGVQVPTGGIVDGAVTQVKLSSDVHLHIDPGGVGTTELADSAVTTSKLANNSVTTGKIVDGTILTADLADGSVTNPKLATDAVDNRVLADSSVATANVDDASITSPKVSSGIADSIGLNDGSNTRRGFLSVAASENWMGVDGTYHLMPTPDKISSVYVPTNGLVYILFRAQWRLVGAANVASIAAFIGSTQLKSVSANAAPAPIGSTLAISGDNWGPVSTVSTANGIFKADPSASSDTTSDDTFPQTWSTGSPWDVAVFEAPSGTFDISVQLKTSVSGGGLLSLRKRKLWVWTEGGW